MKTAIFIDGSNTHATAKMLGVDIDYGKLLGKYPDLLHAYYFTAVLDDREAFISIRPLIDWLEYNGYIVVTKPTKQFTDSSGLTKIKGNMDAELIVKAMQLSDKLDHMVLFSGDGDFTCLLHAMQQRGVRCDVVSSIMTKPSMCADELRRAADVFWDLTDPKMADIIKPISERRSKFVG